MMPLFSRYALTRDEAERLLGRPLRGDPMRGEKAALQALANLDLERVRTLLDDDQIGDDFRALIEERTDATAKRAGKKFIVEIAVSGNAYDHYRRQARELGMNMPLLGGDGWIGDALKNGREALNNSYVSNHYSGDNPDPIVQGFVKAYRARFNRDPDSIAALAYDAVKVLADAITRAGTTESTALRDAIATTDLAGVTGQLKMNPERNVDKPAVILELTFANGELKYNYRSTVNP